LVALGLRHDIAQGRNKLAEHLLGPPDQQKADYTSIANNCSQIAD